MVDTDPTGAGGDGPGDPADRPGGRDLAACVAFCELAGILPAAYTAEDVATWYATLDRPDRTPPDWVFGPVWTTLFALMGVALWLVRREEPSPGRDLALVAFGLQLALNVAWTLVFFKRHSVLGGLFTIAGLLVAIVATLVAFALVRPLAALLLVPYLLWVGFAAYLNAGIWWLNR